MSDLSLARYDIRFADVRKIFPPHPARYGFRNACVKTRSGLTRQRAQTLKSALYFIPCLRIEEDFFRFRDSEIFIILHENKKKQRSDINLLSFYGYVTSFSEET